MISSMQLRRMAIRLWTADVPKHINRHNQKAWIRSVCTLGERWVFLRKQ